MWRPRPYIWRPALSAGKKSQSPSMVVVRPAPTPRPVVVTSEKSGGGSLFAVILGVAAVAFGVMELTGVTHVFGATPAPAPRPPVAPGGGTASAPGSPAAPAPTTPAPTK